jgi:hypothetical protein
MANEAGNQVNICAETVPFNPNGPKVSTRRARRAFGRFSREGHAAKEYELNRGKQAEAGSLAQVEAIYAGGPVGV